MGNVFLLLKGAVRLLKENELIKEDTLGRFSSVKCYAHKRGFRKAKGSENFKETLSDFRYLSFLSSAGSPNSVLIHLTFFFLVTLDEIQSIIAMSKKQSNPPSHLLKAKRRKVSETRIPI